MVPGRMTYPCLQRSSMKILCKSAKAKGVACVRKVCSVYFFETTTPGTDTNPTKRKPTLDPMQKRFSCGEDELCIWRNSRCYRYSATDNGEISVEINNYDINYAIFPDIPLLTSVPSPSKLSETVIWIFFCTVQRVSQLHFTLHLV